MSRIVIPIAGGLDRAMQLSADGHALRLRHQGSGRRLAAVRSEAPAVIARGALELNRDRRATPGTVPIARERAPWQRP